MTTPEGTADGVVDVQGEHATITFVRRIAQPADIVWTAITEPEHLAVWFSPVVIEPHEGGTIELTGPKNIAVTGRILVWDPPRVLEHEWRQAGVGEDSIVRYELTTDGDTTVLTLSHRRFPASDAFGYAPGWHAYLDRLGAYLNGAEVPDWQQRAKDVFRAYANSR